MNRAITVNTLSFDRIWSWPKPAQRPHPPILVGGNGPSVFDRVLAIGDAWFPNHADDIVARGEELRGRADRPIDLMVIGIPADPRVIEEYERAGFRRAVHWLPSAAFQGRRGAGPLREGRRRGTR